LLIITIFIICAIFFILLSLPFALWVYIILSTAFESRRWPTIQGRITDSHIVKNKDCNGLPGYHYSIAYVYKINEQEYYNRTVRSGAFRYFTQAGAQNMADKYPVGKPVLVFYDPDYPDCALLESGFSSECVYPIFLFGFVFAICILFLRLAVHQIMHS